MAAVTQINKIGFLGEDFQYKLVHEFVEDREFFKDLCDIVDQNVFTDPNLKTFVGVMKEFYKTYQVVPSYTDLKIALSNKAHNTIEKEYYDALVDKVHETSSEGSGHTRDLAEKFFKQQNMIRVANEIIRIAGNGDTDNYDKCVDMLNKALIQGTNEDLGSCIFDNENETLSEDYRTPIPTGIGKIDETLEGGLGKGELGVIVGSSSFGKAQPLDAKILTPDGYKLMGDIKIGDYVIGGDGKPHVISGVFPQGKRPIYKVSFSNGTSCECDIEHLWNVKHRKSNKWETVTLSNLIEKGILIENNKWKWAIPTNGEVEFDVPNNEDVRYSSISERKEYLNSLNSSVSKGGRIKRYEGKTLEEAEKILFIARSLGYNASLGKFRKSNCYKINILINSTSLFIINVEYVGEKDAQCIMVDSDEHLYVTEDFIVTHNTSLTTAMSSFAATYRCPQNNNDGYKVLQIVFEDRIKQIQRKHIGRITGVEAKDLSKPGIIEQVKEQLAKYPDRDLMQKNLRIVRLPSGEKTADDIKRLIIKLRNNGFSPDMVIVDYFECLHCKGDSSDDKWEKEGKTMRKFESIAGELNIAMWIPVQGTKDSLNSEVVTMDKAGGSFKKIQIAHIVMSIARTVEDIEANLATIAILKNRAGKAGKVFNHVEFNNGTCRISTDNIDEYETFSAFNKQKEAEKMDAQRDIAKSVIARHKGG